MSTSDFKVLEKVKKLLRLADISRGATPAEAATAAAKAQALLLEHNLCVEDVGDLHKDEKPEEIGREIFGLDATYQTATWHSRLMYRIARPLLCRSVYYLAEQRVSLIGKPSNVAVVKYLYGYLYRQIEIMAVEYQKTWREATRYKEGVVSPNDSARAKKDFCCGCVDTIGDRLDEQYAKHSTSSDNSRALVVVSDKALQEAVKKHHPKVTKQKENRQHDMTSRLAGRVAGATIPLRTGVDGRAGQRRLL